MNFKIKYKFSDDYPGGMYLPNRHESSNSYRYGFNGMEKDDEMKGEGNSYDFGARSYDPRIGRFFSTDPIHQSKQSPYLYAANNPIYFIDIEGKDNIVYLVVLPDSKGSISTENMQDIASQATGMLSELGMTTTVVVLTTDDFNPQYLDANDSYVVLGDYTGIVSEVNSNSNYSDEARYRMTQFNGGNSNPEISTVSDGGGDNQGVFIDVDGMQGFSDNLGLLLNESYALTIVHGIGHNSGQTGHKGTSGGLMWDGGTMAGHTNTADITPLNEDGRPVNIAPEFKLTVSGVLQLTLDISPEVVASMKGLYAKSAGTGTNTNTGVYSQDNYNRNKVTSEEGFTPRGTVLPEVTVTAN